MATPPTFTAGTPLTAAQMNAAGLWLVKSQAVGTSVSSVTVTGAFSADYDNYLVTYTGGVQSTTVDGFLRLGASTTNYAFQIIYAAFGAGAVNTYGLASTSSFLYAISGDTNGSWMNCQLFNPYKTTYTTLNAAIVGSGTTPVYLGGMHKTAASYTDFTVGPNAGTLTGGTIRVYGMRN
jgi:hypothetical protein